MTQINAGVPQVRDQEIRNKSNMEANLYKWESEKVIVARFRYEMVTTSIDKQRKILLCNSNKNMDDGREWKPKNGENKTGEKRYGEDMSKKNLDAKEENVDFFYRYPQFVTIIWGTCTNREFSATDLTMNF